MSMKHARRLFFAVAMALSASAPASADGDAANGEAIYRKCRSCHLVGAGARHTVGPVLNGVIGRNVASASGYVYSQNMKELGSAGKAWTKELLDAYLANPKAIVPYGKMAFPGLPEKSDRDDVIAYLRRYADSK
jgi:cytochrome c